MPTVLAWIIVISMAFLGFAVWGLMQFYARRSTLGRHMRMRFGIKSAIYFAGWWLAAVALGASDMFLATSSPVFPVIAVGVTLPILMGMLFLRRSTSLNSVIDAIPIQWLVGIQLYRAFGLIFLALYAAGHLPAEFAIPAGVGDVLVGVTAPVVGYLFYKGYRWSCLAVLGWNIAGILDLVVAVAVGFLSSPGPFHLLAIETPNELITAFPLVLVPVFAVPLSVVLHLATLKRLKFKLGAASNKAFKGDRQSLRRDIGCALTAKL